MAINESSIPTIIEGWFQYASDHEFGPTLIKYIGHEKGFAPHPIQGAETECEFMNDKKWDDVKLLPHWGSETAWRAKITIEIFEEKELREKKRW